MLLLLQDIDWETYPAECILALTTKGKYVVKCKGLALHDFGLVDAHATKRQCKDGGTSPSTKTSHAITAELVNDFETCKKAFEKETMSHMTSRELDLGTMFL
jgi:hypothetical protein